MKEYEIEICKEDFFGISTCIKDALVKIQMSEEQKENFYKRYKNGEDIYEKDIVKVPLLDSESGDIIDGTICYAVVKYENGSFVVSYNEIEQGLNLNVHIQHLIFDIEVVGNTIDNENLLK